ncbi:hypothetical protein F2Q70_00039478 [Brassica cretica]|uniref:Uncharacterized protein n=1 Tax=Brassica cretica TaxID=69181 RepID=A0A8S9K4F5_BRACR|nr:hypothetical protein F2Q70_00039478 [Brassica cretica]
MHGFVSYRRFGISRSLSNDQAVCMLGRYVATELWLELGRYVVTEPCVCLVATDRALALARPLRSDRAVCVLGRYVATEPWLELGRYVATELGLPVVQFPYSSLSVVGLDTWPFPWTIGIWFD